MWSAVRAAPRDIADTARASPRLRAGGRAVKRARRLAFERLGSDRYSHPAYEDLDRKLAAYLPEREGTFVEVGAYDGYWGSNTYWFERFRHWSGVLIEPLPELAELARIERPRSRIFRCALVPPEHRGAFVTLIFGGAMSVVAGARNGAEEEHARLGARMAGREPFRLDVPARLLSDVLDEASLGRIDLLTLDVEGFEAPVLRGLDLSRHEPRFLLVEMLAEDRDRPAIEAILGGAYEYVARLSSRDHLYRRSAGRSGG